MAFKLLVAVVIFKLVWSRPVVQDVNLYPQELKPLEYQAAGSKNVPDVGQAPGLPRPGSHSVRVPAPDLPDPRRPVAQPYVAEPSDNVNQVPAQRKKRRSHSVGIPAPGLPDPRRPVELPYPKGYASVNRQGATIDSAGRPRAVDFDNFEEEELYRNQQVEETRRRRSENIPDVAQAPGLPAPGSHSVGVPARVPAPGQPDPRRPVAQPY